MELMTAPITARQTTELRVTGRSIAPGLGMGRAWVVADVLKPGGTPAAIGPHEIDGELLRLKRSFEESLAEIDQYRAAHRVRIRFDPRGRLSRMARCCAAFLPRGNSNARLRASLVTAEAVVRLVLERWYQKFKSLESPLLRQRADDVLDVGRNIIRRLCGEQGSGLAVHSREQCSGRRTAFAFGRRGAAQGQRGRGGG